MSQDSLHICHLSLLNPAIHSRIFFKMALSQVEAGYRVSIIAQDSMKRPYMREGVQVIPIGVFGRLSWRRLWCARRVARLAQKLGADVYQVHTVELLAMAKRLKQALPKARVVYDMHEDYVSNILHADYYSEWARPRLAAKVRRIQDHFSHWGDGLIYAEDCFQGTVPFSPARMAIVRNKYQPPARTQLPPLHLRDTSLPMMLYAGTIAENWGILHAIDLWKMLNATHPLNLVVAGHSQDTRLLQRIHAQVAGTQLKDRFAMLGGDHYLPFENLVALIQACTFGVALYRLKENIKDRIPTKFYEFMAQGRPLLFTKNPAWEALNVRHPFGWPLSWPPDAEAVQQLWDQIHWHRSHGFPAPVPQHVWSWKHEAESMLGLIRSITT